MSGRTSGERPENTWFKPEKLKAYYFTYEVIGLLLVVVLVGGSGYVGLLNELRTWTLAVGAGILVVVFGFLTWWIPAFFRTADYRFTDAEIEYRRGVFFRQKTTVPYNRITNITAAQGPIQRLVDAGSVRVHTAGYGGQVGAELTIDAVSDFEEIRDQIVENVRHRQPVATESDVNEGAGNDRGTPGTVTDESLAELRRIRELLERDRPAR